MGLTMKETLLRHRSEWRVTDQGPLDSMAGRGKLPFLLMAFWVVNLSVFFWFFVRYGVFH